MKPLIYYSEIFNSNIQWQDIKILGMILVWLYSHQLFTIGGGGGTRSSGLDFWSGFSKFRFSLIRESSVHAVSRRRVLICSAFCFCLDQMATGADGVGNGSLLGLFLRWKIILFYSRHTAFLTNGSLSKMWELEMCQDETTHTHTH